MPTKKVVAKKIAPAKAVAVKSVKVVQTVKTKAVSKKASHKKPLVFAADPHSFWTTDGAILNSLVALRNALASMDKEVFSHHVAKGKNDFAEWVETVLLDETCAKAIRKAKTASSACAAVEKHLVAYHQ